ncbi:hypothetical protein [Amycolatopsis magusensis]|uniref:hypothetical protein n=1 Tax=Amycolatopsis magusensis TaxID=882444 RepID=UPI003C2B7214
MDEQDKTLLANPAEGVLARTASTLMPADRFDGLPHPLDVADPAPELAEVAARPRTRRGLLCDAISRIIGASEAHGGRLIVVDAIDENAAAFYPRSGSIPVKQTQDRLVMKISAEETTPPCTISPDLMVQGGVADCHVPVRAGLTPSEE